MTKSGTNVQKPWNVSTSSVNTEARHGFNHGFFKVEPKNYIRESPPPSPVRPPFGGSRVSLRQALLRGGGARRRKGLRRRRRGERRRLGGHRAHGGGRGAAAGAARGAAGGGGRGRGGGGDATWAGGEGGKAIEKKKRPWGDHSEGLFKRSLVKDRNTPLKQNSMIRMEFRFASGGCLVLMGVNLLVR